MDLRRHLAHRLSFDIIDLPDVGSPVAILSSLSTTADLVVGEITRLQTAGPISIVGFSFGGSLAVEVATQLQRSHRDIAYLGLIDAPLKIRNLQQTLSITPRRSIKIAKRALQKLKERLDLRNAQRNVEKGLELNVQQRRSYLLHLREIAVDEWEPQQCLARGMIILSNLMYERTHETWSTLCPNCKLIRTPSDHEHIIKGESLDRVASALADDIAGVTQLIEGRAASTPAGERRPL